jgi:hypothetical protein
MHSNAASEPDRMTRLLDGPVDLEFGLLWFFDHDDAASDPPRLVPPATMVLSERGGVIAAQHMVDGAVRVVVDLGEGGAPAELTSLMGSGVLSLPSGRLVLTGDAAAETKSEISLPAGSYLVTVRSGESVDPAELHFQLVPRTP